MSKMAIAFWVGGVALTIVVIVKLLIRKLKRTMKALEPGEKTPPGVLCQDVLAQLIQKLDLEEVKTEGNDSWMDLHVRDFMNHTIMGEDRVGEIRLFTGPTISKVVYCRITVAWMGMVRKASGEA